MNTEKAAAQPPSARTRVRRYHWLADYEQDTVKAILDAVPLCHVGYTQDGLPHVTPTLQWRDGDTVYWHGSSASRMLKAVRSAEVCLSVTAMDGLVLARSAYNFNVNFRSVIIFGKARQVTDPAEKLHALEKLVARFVPGHWDALRPVTEQELKATMVVSMPITEASSKVRTGQPIDEDEDYGFPVWAGIVPIVQTVLPPEADPRNLPGVAMPASLTGFHIG